MTEEEFVRQIGALKRGRSGDQRAPHKPLLLLLALGDIARGRPRQRAFADLAPQLEELLARFAPAVKTLHPEIPFVRLANDGVWDVTHDVPRGPSGAIPRKFLVDEGVAAGFPQPLFSLLATDERLVADVTKRLLNAYFPASQHADIRNAVGLTGTLGQRDVIPERTAHPDFEYNVLRAYERHCAVCGFDIRLVDDLLGLEAAHIMKPEAGGPDEVSNGLALCGFHRIALERGAIGMEPFERGFRVLVSTEISGQSDALRWLLDYSGRLLRKPQVAEWEPDPSFVAWHREEVFQGPAKSATDA